MIYAAYNFMMRAAAGLHKRVFHLTRVQPILDSIDRNSVILEIGGGYNPVFTKERYPRAYHLDHCDQTALRDKYSCDPLVRHLVDRIQPIDFISDGRPIHHLMPEHLRFDIVFSSHALEHQVDLVAHLNSVAALLKPAGRVLMVIPDHRRCFDALRFPSSVSDAIDVHRRGHSIHRGRQLMDATSRKVESNPARRLRWPDFFATRFTTSLRESYRAMIESEHPNAHYQDVHAWVFSPRSFELLMIELYLLELIKLRASYVSAPYGPQFFVVLEPAAGLSTLSTADAERLEKRRFKLTRALFN